MNRYSLFLVAAMLLVGSNVGIGKTIVAFLPVPMFALLRFVIALAVLWPLLRVARMRRVKRGEWVNLFLQALFGTFGFTLLMLGGVHRTSAVAAGVITSTIPAVVALFSWLFLRERPDARAFASIALAIAGIAVINLAHAGSGAQNAGSFADNFAGNLMVLGAVCCESFYVILSRRLTQTLAPLEICAYTHLFGFLLMLPVGLPGVVSFVMSPAHASVPVSVWALVIWYGLSASVFSFCLWMMGIRHVPGSVAGVFSAVLPVAAALYGIAFLDERPTPAHGIALACVIGGIALASLKTRRLPPVAS
ncbi:DMT family transporter [Paraburkholderia sacchari]|uniref:DMT family transporter n=1 Tax=Paraburkholderia sacchari TaxID=159450 RepID=UPI00054278F1|nr:DMT family transporter [Paraburkholderia sacchari]NLP62554.1 DMT family transporter [Paraburkholderia sacchari]